MNLSDLDDTYLLQLLQESNEAAFAEVYNRYWKLLYVTAYKILRSSETAKDLVQEVFVSLWQRRAESNIQILKPYLQQAIRFQVLKAIREQKADEAFYVRLAEITTDIFYENPLLFKEQEALFMDIMNALPEDCRLIFRLNREEQLTYRQIAAQLQISEKTVEKKMSISLRHIRQALAQNRALCVALFILIFCSR